MLLLGLQNLRDVDACSGTQAFDPKIWIQGGVWWTQLLRAETKAAEPLASLWGQSTAAAGSFRPLPLPVVPWPAA